MGYTRRSYRAKSYESFGYGLVAYNTYGLSVDTDGLVFYAPLLTSLREIYGAVPTFTRASIGTYIGSDGLLKTAAVNEPRFEFDTGGGARGYLSEGTRTNLALHSEDSSNAVYVKTNITVGSDVGTAPDGTTTADRLTATAANATIIQDLGVLGADDYSYSVWIARVTGTGDIDLTVDGGSTWTTVPVVSGITRFDVTTNVANPDIGIRIVASGDVIDVWGHDGEAGGFSSSYIPTQASTVPRAVDDLGYAFVGTAARSMEVTADRLDVSGPPAVIHLSMNDGTTNNRHLISSTGVGVPSYSCRSSGAGQATINVGQLEKLAPERMVATFDTNSFNFYVDGEAGTPDLSGNLPVSLTNIDIGTVEPGGDPSFGHMLGVKIYNRVLSAGEV